MSKDELTINEALKILDEDWDDFNDPDDLPITKEEYAFAEELSNFIQSLIDVDDEVSEDFVSEKCLYRHYDKHCLDGEANRQSTRSNVFYDFRDVNKYREYCDKTTDDILRTKYQVYSLLDTESVYRCVRKLFEGSTSIKFEISCGFENESGSVSIGVHSYANKATTNYLQNTLDFSVISRKNKTISMYPVDASYFETKFNNLISKYNKLGVRLKLNH